jgi:hypothetical protein
MTAAPDGSQASRTHIIPHGKIKRKKKIALANEITPKTNEKWQSR